MLGRVGILSSLLRIFHPVRTTKRAVRRALIPRPVRKVYRTAKTVAIPVSSVKGAVKYKAIGAVDRAITPTKRRK